MRQFGVAFGESAFCQVRAVLWWHRNLVPGVVCTAVAGEFEVDIFSLIVTFLGLRLEALAYF